MYWIISFPFFVFGVYSVDDICDAEHAHRKWPAIAKPASTAKSINRINNEDNKDNDFKSNWGGPIDFI
jgi:hypothetical protein